MVSALLNRYKFVSEVSPAKSPAVSSAIFRPDRSIAPVTPVRWVAVTSAQTTAAPSLFPISRSSSSRTFFVRSQMPAATAVSLSLTVTATSSIAMPL